jgi:hypothetical protein
MKTSTIENETNNITLHTTVQAAEAVANTESFRNEAGLAKLAANWPAARLVEIWNNLPGATPIKKFTDRKTAVSRIWKAIQSLDSTAEKEITQESEVAPVIETEREAEVVPATTEVNTAAGTMEQEPNAESLLTEESIPESVEPALATPIAPQTAHVAPEEAPAKNKATRTKRAPKAATNASVRREESKTSQVIAMLKREGGTTLEEIMAAMGWQKHTTRAMLSAGGSLTKKHGLVITSEKVGDKRTYTIKA